MAATLQLPKDSAKELVLVYKYTKAETIASIESATDDNQIVALNVNGEKIEGVKTIAKYLCAKTRPELLGDNKEEQAELEEWLSWAVSSFKNVSTKEINAALQKLNIHLSTRTFLVGNHLTLADLLAFANVHGVSKNLRVTSSPNVLRWFDLIQNLVVKNDADLSREFTLLGINLDDVPEPVIAAPKKEAKKGGDKGSKEEKAAKPEKAEPKKEKEQGKKEKKEKKEKKDKGGEKKAAEPAGPEQPVVSRLDIRVGYIRSCRKHEGADSLYVEEIDLGDGEGVYRTVVSGLVKWYPLEEMQNRWVICLANLKPATMRGIKSEGMVLCATAPDGSRVELLTPEDTSKVKPGDRVYFEGLEGEPEKQLPPKKKYWETVQPDFNTKDDLFAYYQDKPFLIRTASGEPVRCKVPTVQKGSIK